MNGGKIVSSDGAVRVASTSYEGYTGISASFVMNGGEIDAAWDGIFVQQSNVTYDKLNVTVNGGSIKSALNPIRVYGPAPSAARADAINITLNGGSFAYTGSETYEWIIDGVLRVGGGNSAEIIVGNGKVVVSAALAERLTVAAADYKWVDNGDGTAKLALKDIVARVNGVAYESFDAAIAALKNGDTLTLEKDVTVNGVFALMQNVTVDLNGKTLTAAAVAMFGNGSIVDNGATKGKIAVPEGYLMMNKATYPMLPIWNEAGDGYVFVSVIDQTKVADKGDGKFEVEFRPSISGGGVSTSAVFKDGAADNGITFMVYVHFMQDGAVAKTLDLSVSDSIIKKVYAEQLSVKLTLTGATDAYDSYVIELVMISDTGVSYSSNIAELVPATAVDEAA
jgi:hypothetical protein